MAYNMSTISCSIHFFLLARDLLSIIYFNIYIGTQNHIIAVVVQKIHKQATENNFYKVVGCPLYANSWKIKADCLVGLTLEFMHYIEGWVVR